MSTFATRGPSCSDSCGNKPRPIENVVRIRAGDRDDRGFSHCCWVPNQSAISRATFSIGFSEVSIVSNASSS